MSKIHVSSAGKKEDLTLFSCNFHLLQKVSFFLCQIQNFTPDNLDIEPVGPILYRNNQLIQIITYVEDWMYISKVTLKNHVKLKLWLCLSLEMLGPGSQQSRAVVNEAIT